MEFTSLGQFSVHLKVLGAKMPMTKHRALEKAAKLVLRTAQAKIGEYQPAAGPFTAWAPLAAATMSDRITRGFPSDQPLLRLGTLRDSYTYDITGPEASIGSDSWKALWLEMGTRHMPPRAVIGPALVEESEHVVEILGHGVVTALLGGVSAEVARG